MESLIVKGLSEGELKKLITNSKSKNNKADSLVEQSLLAKAAGFYYEEQEVSVKKEVFYENGKKVREVSEPVVLNVSRYKSSEYNAQVFWLINRKPDFWKDKKDFKPLASDVYSNTSSNDSDSRWRIVDDIFVNNETESGVDCNAASLCGQ